MTEASYTIAEDFGAVRVISKQSPLTNQPYEVLDAIAVPGMRGDFSGVSIEIPPPEAFDDVDILYHFARRLPVAATDIQTVLLYLILNELSAAKLFMQFFDTEGAILDPLYNEFLRETKKKKNIIGQDGRLMAVFDLGANTFRPGSPALQLAGRYLKCTGFHPSRPRTAPHIIRYQDVQLGQRLASGHDSLKPARIDPRILGNTLT